MRVWLAVFRDALAEAWDRRAFQVLSAFALLFTLACFSIAFHVRTAADVLEERARELDQLTLRMGSSTSSSHGGGSFELSAASAVRAGDGLPPELEGGHWIEVRFLAPADLDTMVQSWQRHEQQRAARRLFVDEEEQDPEPLPPVGAPERRSFLEQRFRAFGYDHVHVAEQGERDGGPVYRVAVRSARDEEVEGGHAVSLLFGLWEFPTGEFSAAEMMVMFQTGLANTFAGFIGLLVALLVSAGFLPSLLQKGTLDLMLARPIGRSRLLLYKYSGGIGFVFLFGLLLFGGTWLAFAVRTDFASLGYLACILTLVFGFAVLYAVAVPVAVLTRSGTLSALAAVGVWGAGSAVATTRQVLDMTVGEGPSGLRQVLDAVYTVLPKVSDLGDLNAWMVSRGLLSEQAWELRFSHQVPEVDWVFSLGTTALFALGMLGLGVWQFRRRDY